MPPRREAGIRCSGRQDRRKVSQTGHRHRWQGRRRSHRWRRSPNPADRCGSCSGWRAYRLRTRPTSHPRPDRSTGKRSTGSLSFGLTITAQQHARGGVILRHQRITVIQVLLCPRSLCRLAQAVQGIVIEVGRRRARPLESAPVRRAPVGRRARATGPGLGQSVLQIVSIAHQADAPASHPHEYQAVTVAAVRAARLQLSDRGRGCEVAPTKRVSMPQECKLACIVFAFPSRREALDPVQQAIHQKSVNNSDRQNNDSST